MRRIWIALVFVLLCTAPLASAQKAIDITPGSIVGIKLGMTKTQARALLDEDRPHRPAGGRLRAARLAETEGRGLLPDGLEGRGRRHHLEPDRSGRDEQIGPCSTVAALKQAYGARLQPFRRGGKAIAYRLGNLVFTTEDGKRVGVVALGRGTAAMYVALNATECA